ncbi:MAG: hypothetical protein GWN81_20520 [Phycisphaerae bacterium]|nr:hypothetical protein [Phycisphaerae bacterium]
MSEFLVAAGLGGGHNNELPRDKNRTALFAIIGLPKSAYLLKKTSHSTTSIRQLSKGFETSLQSSSV